MSSPAEERSEVPLTIKDFEDAAAESLADDARVFLNGGSGSGNAVKRNNESWQKYNLIPRTLRSLKEIDASFEILGQTLKAPIGMAPIGALGALHPDGEQAITNPSVASSYLPIVASHSSLKLEQIKGLSEAHWWFQLYLHKDREVSSRLLTRALGLGAKAVVFTVDLPVVGYRDADRKMSQKNRLVGLPGQSNSEYPNLGIESSSSEVEEHVRVFDAVLDHRISKDDLAWVLRKASVPVFVKGVLRPDEAKRYLEMGAAGIIVSNHGGRALESAPAPANKVRAMRAELGSEAKILVDGGIRRGDDIAKALCLGADMVLVGRPYAWGLAASGAEGILRTLDILWAELRTVMAFLGADKLSDLSSDMIEEIP